MTGTLFLAGNHLLFFGNLGSRVDWSRRGLNPGPSDPQPDAMTTQLTFSSKSVEL